MTDYRMTLVELLQKSKHPASTAAGSDQAAAAWAWDVYECQGSSSCNLAALAAHQADGGDVLLCHYRSQK